MERLSTRTGKEEATRPADGPMMLTCVANGRYVPKRWRDGRVMPGWYTWQQAHSHQQRSPFGMSAKKFDEYHDRGSRRSSSRSRPDSFSSSL